MLQGFLSFFETKKRRIFTSQPNGDPSSTWIAASGWIDPKSRNLGRLSWQNDVKCRAKIRWFSSKIIKKYVDISRRYIYTWTLECNPFCCSTNSSLSDHLFLVASKYQLLLVIQISPGRWASNLTNIAILAQSHDACWLWPAVSQKPIFLNPFESISCYTVFAQDNL